MQFESVGQFEDETFVRGSVEGFLKPWRQAAVKILLFSGERIQFWELGDAVAAPVSKLQWGTSFVVGNMLEHDIVDDVLQKFEVDLGREIGR